MGKHILVRGDILIYRYFEYANLVALMPETEINEMGFDITVDGDLIIDELYTEDYLTNIYYATGGITALDQYNWEDYPNYKLREIYLSFRSYLYESKFILNKHGLYESLEPVIYRLVYINIFGAMEAFLFRLLKHKIFSDEAILKQFITTFPSFKEEKISLSEAYDANHRIEKRVEEIIDSINYHQLPKIKNIYKSTLDISIDISKIIPHIEKRHDFVHRNGVNIKLDEISIDKKEVETLFDHMEKMVESVVDQAYCKKATQQTIKLDVIKTQ